MTDKDSSDSLRVVPAAAGPPFHRELIEAEESDEFAKDYEEYVVDVVDKSGTEAGRVLKAILADATRDNRQAIDFWAVWKLGLYWAKTLLIATPTGPERKSDVNRRAVVEETETQLAFSQLHNHSCQYRVTADNGATVQGNILIRHVIVHFTRCVQDGKLSPPHPMPVSPESVLTIELRQQNDKHCRYKLAPEGLKEHK